MVTVTGGLLMVMLSVAVLEAAGLAESVTFTTTLNVPAAVGVPVMLLPLIPRPAGAPLIMLQL